MKLEDIFFSNIKDLKSFNKAPKTLSIIMGSRSGSWSSYWTKLTFDDIVNVPVADASSVSDWNTWFDLPTNGTPYTSVSVDGNDVILTGGSNIKLKDNLFYVDDILFTSLLEFVDSGCITEVGNYCFFRCTSLANLSFSENLIKIGELAFCGGIFTEFTIPNSVTTIGTSALYYCVQLTNIVFGTGLSELPGSLFDSCSSLTDIIIPNHITFLGRACFNNCISLKTVTFLGCTVVSDDCFMNNGGTMTDVYYYCMIAPIILYIGSAFQTGSAKVLHIPIGATGYDVQPWINVSLFASIVQDL